MRSSFEEAGRGIEKASPDVKPCLILLYTFVWWLCILMPSENSATSEAP